MKTSSFGNTGTGSQKFALTCAVSFSKDGTGTGPPGTVSGAGTAPDGANEPAWKYVGMSGCEASLCSNVFIHSCSNSACRRFI